VNEDAVVSLTHGQARASVALRGAEWRTWRVGARDLLWQPDPAFWSATAPVLFPVCGWTRGGHVRIGGRSFPLGLHGFAAQCAFEVAEQGDDFVNLVLRDDDYTRALYPFRFELTLSYRLMAHAVEIRAGVVNRNAAPMPYAVGLHPGFRWPFAGDDPAAYRVRFDQPESPLVPIIASGGLFSPRRRTVTLDQGCALQLSHETFSREALCFLHVQSRGLTFEAPDGAAIRMDIDGFPHVVLWSRPGAPFLCLETWTGHGDPEGFEGDFLEKPSMIHLAPGAVNRHAAIFSFC
jgi:galactose mutarotase-like enzyme